jgi:hypothetical protein
MPPDVTLVTPGTAFTRLNHITGLPPFASYHSSILARFQRPPEPLWVQVVSTIVIIRRRLDKCKHLQNDSRLLLLESDELC